MTSEAAAIERLATEMDWGQVVRNGGPPCFFVGEGKFCGRAERWSGHGLKDFHDFVPLHQLLKAEFERGISQERERCAKLLQEVNESHTRGLSSGTGKITVCDCS